LYIIIFFLPGKQNKRGDLLKESPEGLNRDSFAPFPLTGGAPVSRQYPDGL